VPNSVIKSALAAEWRLESYLLGKAPTLKNSIRKQSDAMKSSSSIDSDGTRSRASFIDPGTVEVDGFDTLASDLYPAAPGRWATTPPPASVTASSVSSSPGFTQALMQASHAESLSGTTADLLSVVLGRDAKPWGFSYTDIRHPCKIWYGADDERVSEKSMRWMERAMDAELLVVPGEGHNLMSSRMVMFDVLDSIAEDI
jgi:pimeloyl-ACP methyl ester carboxylesterase